MAATMILPAKNGSAVLAKILQRVARGSCVTGTSAQRSNLGSHVMRLKRRVWTMKDADPAVSAASYAAAPVKMGDLVYRINSDEVFICSVAPGTDGATTAASFIQCHA